MTGAVNVKPVIHGAAVAAGKLNPFPNLCKDRDRGERNRERERGRDRKARFEETLSDKGVGDAGGGEGGAGDGYGGAGASAGDDKSTSSCSGRMTAVKHYQQQQEVSMGEQQPLPASLPDGAVIPKDQQTGELPPFGEHKVQQSQQAQRGNNQNAAVQEGQENRRLRGKLKWLFEQDRMYWESNSSKSSRRGSPEIDRTRGLKVAVTTATVSTPTTAASAIKLVGDEPSNDAKLLQAVEDSFKMENSKKVQPHNRKPPRQPHDNTHKGKVSREKKSLPDRTSTPSATTTTAIVTTVTENPSATTKVPWTFSKSAPKFWPRGPAKSRAAEDSKKRSFGEAAAQSHSSAAATARRHNQSSVDHDRRVGRTDSVTLMSSLDLGAEGYFSDVFDDGLKSVDTSDLMSSEDDDDDSNSSESDDSDQNPVEGLGGDVDDDGRMRTGNTASDGGGAVPGGGGDDRGLMVAKNQAAYLRAKCDMLCKEKHDALKKWQKSRREIDEAAKMAQALRTAIETLLEAGATDSTADFKAKQDILEGHTQALKLRMAKLRRKNSPEFGKDLSFNLAAGVATDSSSKSLHDRIETLKRTSEGRSLASPEIPRDTEHNVEALRARLDQLMLATNSRVSDEQSQARRRARAQKRPVEELQHVNRKSQTKEEKGELKMKGWLNSLSAELTEEAQQGATTTADGDCERCSPGQAGFFLRDLDAGATPFTSKQGTPSTSKQVSPMHSMHERDGLPSSEETKKMVIHKIAEEVRLEAEQWFQVQELLGRVGEDMKSLQEACSTWERRAILAEAQVECMQHEGQETTQNKGKQPENDKITGLQKEMCRLKETLDDVRNQLGMVGVDPSRWFEAAHTYGYAFMPVNLPSTTSCACKGKCQKISSCEVGSTPAADSAGDRWKQKGISAIAGSKMQQPSSSANSSIAHSVISSLEKSPPGDSETGRKSQIPQRGHRKSTSEMARAPAEDEESMTSMTPPPPAAGEVSKYEHHSSAVKEVLPMGGEGGGGSGGRATQDRPTAKVFHKEQPSGLGLETSGAGSREDMLLQMQSSARERCIVHPDDHLSRYPNFIVAASRRSPLKDVLENIASAKENKRPF